MSGLINWRDVGGVATADGRQMRPGLVFRSDSLDQLAQAAIDGVLRHGIRTVVDLRSTEEVDGYGKFDQPGVRWIHHPLGAKPSGMRKIFESGRDPMVLNYRMMTAELSGAVASILDDIASATEPLVFHCTSGKDRTGVIAALIQIAVGVPNNTVLAEYLASSRNLSDHLELMEKRYPEMAANVPLDQRVRMAGTDPEWLNTALNPIHEAGGVEGWLLANGAEPGIVARLQDRLLE